MPRMLPSRRHRCATSLLSSLLWLLVPPLAAHAQDDKPIQAPPPRAEGEGPFSRLILRGVTVIDGTGAPAYGPADIVIEGNRIARIRTVGVPGLPIDPKKRPELKAGDKEIDLAGMVVLPGFVDLHGHLGGSQQGVSAEYVLKLWLAHGVTTVRDPGSGNGLDWVLERKKESEKNTITAPRLRPYVFFGADREGPFTTPEQAITWIREQAKRGADGFKFFGYRPDILEAAIREAKRLGLGTACHHAQLAVTRVNALDSARWGLTTIEHWYGVPEALFEDRTVQDYPAGYNYNDEQHRFGQAGRLWKQSAAPGSERWNAVRDEMIALGVILDPTLNIYEASRDLMRAYRAEWHEDYTLPSLWKFFAPNRDAHGSYWFDWTTADEIAWKDNYRRWMAFLNDFKNHGGKVTVGTDSGYIYQTYGFAYVRELELLQEAGFHPLEVVRAATLHGAQALRLDAEIGSIEPGKLADLVVVAENPLANFKVLYGTGWVRVNEKNETVRAGGVRYTIKDGIVFDAPKLLADVRQMVAEAKKKEGIERLLPPGR
jgi:imidazolonepropionase-like amidohydrolase